VSLYEHVRHPWRDERADRGPVRVEDQHPTGTPASRFNTRLALLITRVVGSMWCAYAFAAFDLLSLKAAIDGGIGTIVAWIAQTFLQLVLLSIIMVGQNVQGAAADARSEATFKDAELILHSADQIAAHLTAQDAHLHDQDTAAAGILTQVQQILTHLTSTDGGRPA
jgi:hypothetical protein